VNGTRSEPPALQYAAVGHITGIHIASIDLTLRLPWIYLIASVGSRVLYVGETYALGGLVGRLSEHFGPFVSSTLKQRAEDVASVRILRPPFVVLAARLPLGDDDAPFDAASKQVRLICEALLHELVALQFLPTSPEWTIVSTPQGAKISTTEAMQAACASIYGCFTSIYGFLGPLSTAAPFQLVILEEKKAKPVPSEEDLGRLVEEIEMSLFEWMLNRLKEELGEDEDKRWVEGIPQPTRVECAKRREEEVGGQAFPREAYLSLIDLRAIAQKNWSLFQAVFEQVSGLQGKDKATAWLVELNETRKIWAHPIKKLFVPVDPARVMAVRTLCSKVRQALMKV
jgi:hypothetical protein